MKQVGTNLDDKTIEQMKELAEIWGLPEVRHHAAVISRCVERVWWQEIGKHENHEQSPQETS